MTRGKGGGDNASYLTNCLEIRGGNVESRYVSSFEVESVTVIVDLF